MKKAAIKKMIQWSALTVLLAYLFSLGGYYVVFGVMEFQAKQTMHELIAHSTDYRQLGLEKIQFSKSDPRKINADEDEFTFKGKRYDVVSSKESADTITLFCIWDENEQAVTTALQNYQEINSPGQQSSQQKTILNIFKMLNSLAVVESGHFTVYMPNDILALPFSNKTGISNVSDVYSPPKYSC